MRILLVEDEPSAAHMLSKGLREHAYAVDVAVNGADGMYRAAITDYDAIVRPSRPGWTCAGSSEAPAPPFPS
jgi:DNA-binding response OmpR family regulator